MRSLHYSQTGNLLTVDSAAKSCLGSPWNCAVPHYLDSTHQGPAKLVNTNKFLSSQHHRRLLEIHVTLVFLQKWHPQDGALLQLADYERLVNHLITDASR